MVFAASNGFNKMRAPKLESIRETLWGLPSSKTVGALEMHTWKISPQAFMELSPPCAASAVVRTKTKQSTAIRQAVLFRTRVDIRHMNRYLVAHTSILHNWLVLHFSKSFQPGYSATTGEGIIWTNCRSRLKQQIKGSSQRSSMSYRS